MFELAPAADLSASDLLIEMPMILQEVAEQLLLEREQVLAQKLALEQGLEPMPWKKITTKQLPAKILLCQKLY